ncbi:MAG: hypothetical protein GX193_01305 [Clostridiales bacterium]|nr:hypothetical protein [Clostridiales bacterium]
MGYNTVGGIAGLNEAGWISSSDKQYAPSVTSCINYGTVTYNSALSGNELGFYIGGIVGYAEAYSKITQCKVEENSDGSNPTVTGRKYVGGIVGFADATEIIGTEGTGTTITVTVNGVCAVGAVAGYVKTGVVKWYNTGNDTTVTETDRNGLSDAGKIGGIVGVSDQNSLFENCHVGGTTKVTGISDNVGGIAGSIAIGTRIANCSTGSMVEISGGRNTGGIVGCCSLSYYYESVTVENCRVIGTSVSGTDYVGGIAGYLLGYTGISNCEVGDGTTMNETRVTGNRYVGGIAGYMKENYSSVKNCNVVGDTVVSGNNNTGGIAGYLEKAAYVRDCEVSGTVNVTGTVNVGGIAGYLTINAKVEGSSILDNTAVTGTQYVGGIAGMTESYTYVTSCSTGSSTKVTGENYIGGIVGYSYAQIKSCINGSTIVKLMEDSICGSIAGYVYSTSYIVDCTGADPQWGAAGN